MSITNDINDTATMMNEAVTNEAATNERALPDPSRPYVLQRDEGVHHHFLDNLATTKIGGTAGGAMSAVEFVAPKGFGPPLHQHDDEDEMMVILDGEIVFRSGDIETVAQPGATVHLPHGVPHTFQVLSDTARMVSITASRTTPPKFAEMVAALGDHTDEPVLPAPMDIDPVEVAAICAAHGVEVLGPPPAPLD